MYREKIYIVIIVLLIIVLIIFVVLTQEEKKDFINVSECSKVKGEFSVEAGYESSNVLNLCGSNGTSVCSFTVSNLQNAIDICNTNAEKCLRFMYNEQTKNISFISDIPTYKINPNNSIYIRESGNIINTG